MISFSFGLSGCQHGSKTYVQSLSFLAGEWKKAVVWSQRVEWIILCCRYEHTTKIPTLKYHEVSRGM